MSDVKRLLEDIELNFRAAQAALGGLSQGSATHQFITKKMERIEEQRVALIGIVGSKKASDLLIQTLDNIQ